jgi:hypothetical protein
VRASERTESPIDVTEPRDGTDPVRAHTRGVSTAAALVNSTAASSRLRLDLDQLSGREENRVPALDRLEAAVGSGLVQRLLAELSERDLRRLEAALSPEFAERITSLLAEERSGTD